MQQVQPGFPMPPPATIYGHIASALGECFDPDGVAFAYHFTAQGSTEDLEHIHVLSGASGKLPGSKIPKVVEGNVNPFSRHILFRPQMVLYINRPDWESAFRMPCYPVVLGRSQDLCSYSDIRIVTLEQQEQVYFEHTLLPYGMATQTAVGSVVMMPRWLDYARHRHPTFARYVILQRRVKSTELLRFGDAPIGPYWSDPTAPQINQIPLGLIFHTFTGDAYEAINLAS